MTTERHGWLVVGTLFATLFFVFGSGYNTAGVFFTPLLQEFGWSRTQLSLLQTALALSAGLVVPVVGRLLDRTDARAVIVTGTVLSGVGFVVASRAWSYGSMVIAYVLLGLGIGAGTLLPVSLVITNWFGARRGFALGIATLGTSLGGMLMTLVANQVIARAGWRTGYLALALPMFVIVVPMVVATVRTRPPRAGAGSQPVSAASLPGLEVADALRARSFWLIGLAQFCFTFAAAGLTLHLIPHLTGLGYSSTRAAAIASLVLGFAGAGKLLMGLLADRIGGRRTLVLDLLMNAGGMGFLLLAATAPMAAAFVLIYGLAAGAPLTLIPMVLADSVGLRRLGSLLGLSGLFNVLGAALGPVVAGRLFDVSGSYASTFQLYAVVLVGGATFASGCVSLAPADARGAELRASA